MGAKRVTISLDEEIYKAVRLYALFSSKHIGTVCADAIRTYLLEAGADNLRIVNDPDLAQSEKPFDSRTTTQKPSTS
jgi:hypothetical protein